MRGRSSREPRARRGSRGGGAPKQLRPSWLSAVALLLLVACGSSVDSPVGGAPARDRGGVVPNLPPWCQYGNTCTRKASCDGTVVSSCPALPKLSWPSWGTIPAGNDARLGGGGSVGADGQYHYELPLDVPPGRMGMAPSLSLSYSSAWGNGPLGVGWALNGQSVIAPCVQTVATNGAAVPVKMDGSDKLCLDGQQLVDVSGNATLFATENDGFKQITLVQPSELGAIAANDNITSRAY